MATVRHDSAEQAPAAATEAVFKISEEVPKDAVQVEGIDFNQYQSRAMTVEELVGGMARMGFQASGVSEAVRIINDMVRCSNIPSVSSMHDSLRSASRGAGAIPRQHRARLSSWATLRT